MDETELAVANGCEQDQDVCAAHQSVEARIAQLLK